MKKIFISILITVLTQQNIIAQKKIIDSLEDQRLTEIIRENVQKFSKTNIKDLPTS